MTLFDGEKIENVKGFRFKKSELGIFSKASDEAVSELKKDCRILGFTDGNFSLIDLIYSVLKIVGRARVIIGTWSAGIKDVNQVKWMMQEDLITDFKLLTDHSYKTRQKKYAGSIEELFGVENIRTSEMHAKFVLIQNDNWSISIRSSMNLNANKTTELFEIDENEEIYQFLYKYIDYHFENMEVGFVSDTKKVNKCVNDFFQKKQEKEMKEKNNIFKKIEINFNPEQFTFKRKED